MPFYVNAQVGLEGPVLRWALSLCGLGGVRSSDGRKKAHVRTQASAVEERKMVWRIPP